MTTDSSGRRDKTLSVLRYRIVALLTTRSISTVVSIIVVVVHSATDHQGVAEVVVAGA